jgi:hypothetical protein
MRFRYQIIRAAAAFVLAATIASATFAQALPNLTDVLGGPPKTESAAEQSPVIAPAAQLATKRAENAELLRVAQRRLEAGAPTDSAAAQEVATYKTIEAVLAQQEAVDQQIAELNARKTELETQLRSTRTGGAANPARISFVEFDRLKDELTAELARVNQAADRLVAAKAALENAQKALAKSESKRRQAQDEFEDAPRQRGPAWGNVAGGAAVGRRAEASPGAAGLA